MIIGICGLIGSGKGTVADILINEYNYQKISFADSLKDAITAIFGWDREMIEGVTSESREWREMPDEYWSNEMGREITPRYVLQHMGTNCLRDNFFDGIWVSSLKQKVLNNPDTNFVVPDARFPNEIMAIKNLNGDIWQVRRGDLPEWWQFAILDNTTDSRFMDEYNVHPSEWKWVNSSDRYDHIIYNDSTLEVLKDQVVNRLASK